MKFRSARWCESSAYDGLSRVGTQTGTDCYRKITVSVKTKQLIVRSRTRISRSEQNDRAVYRKRSADSRPSVFRHNDSGNRFVIHCSSEKQFDLNVSNRNRALRRNRLDLKRFRPARASESACRAATASSVNSSAAFLCRFQKTINHKPCDRPRRQNYN